MRDWTKEEQAEHRKQWVAALKSGKYRQTVHQLRNDGAMCCLGVACEISGLGEWHEQEYFADDHGSKSVVPWPVQQWLGLRDDTGAFMNGDEALAALNDAGMTFAEIADIIESEPEGLVAK